MERRPYIMNITREDLNIILYEFNNVKTYGKKSLLSRLLTKRKGYINLSLPRNEKEYRQRWGI